MDKFKRTIAIEFLKAMQYECNLINREIEDKDVTEISLSRIIEILVSINSKEIAVMELIINMLGED